MVMNTRFHHYTVITHLKIKITISALEVPLDNIIMFMFD